MTDYSLMISLLGIALSAATFFVGRATASRQQGKTDGTMQTMLMNIAEQVKTLNAKMDKMDEQYIRSAKDIARLEARMDALEKRA